MVNKTFNSAEMREGVLLHWRNGALAQGVMTRLPGGRPQ